MLHDLETLTGSDVIATDGKIGKVSDFLFDDQSWTICYLVVDVASWLTRRDVVLAMTAVEHPHWTKKTVHLHLTKEQVRNSPDVDTEKPVSRQQEIAMMEYFGPLARWADREVGAPEMATGMKYPVHTREDSHLRSVWHLADYALWAADGEIGHLKGFIVDEASWHIGYLTVKAGDWLHRHSVLIPTRSVESISWADRRVNLRKSWEEI